MHLAAELPSQKTYAFVNLEDTAKLTSIQIVTIYTFTSNAEE